MSGKSGVQYAPAEGALAEEGDGVWGKLGEGSPNYKNVGWWVESFFEVSHEDGSENEKLTSARIVSGIFLINLQIGLGVLSMPNTLHTLGLVPGILVIAGVAAITTWTDISELSRSTDPALILLQTQLTPSFSHRHLQARPSQRLHPRRRR